LRDRDGNDRRFRHHAGDDGLVRPPVDRNPDRVHDRAGHLVRHLGVDGGMTQTVLPEPTRPASVFISPFSIESLAHGMRAGVSGVPASAAYPTAQRALFFPFRTYRPETVKRFFWVNGTTASTDDVAVGVYDTAGNSIKLGTSSGANHGTLAAGAS